jgi:hypothetical protein
MSPPSNSKSPRLSWLSSHLAMAEAILGLQMRVNAITAELARLRTAQPVPGGPGPPHRPRRPMDWKALAEWAETVGRIFSLPWVQAVIGLALPVLAYLGRWLTKLVGG